MNASQNMADVSKKIGLVILLLSPLRLLAEDSAPKDFYRHDYAKSTYERKEGEEDKKVEGAQKGKTKVQSEKSNGIFGGDVGFKEMKEEKAPEIKEDTSYLEKSGNDVLSVGLISNADSEEHTFQNINELLDLAIKNDWGIGQVLLVGANKDIMAKPEMAGIIRMAGFRFGKISYSKKIPEKYAAIKKSPTWIVQTPKGQVLLEAVGPLRKKFNKKGQLIEQ